MAKRHSWPSQVQVIEVIEIRPKCTFICSDRYADGAVVAGTTIGTILCRPRVRVRLDNSRRRRWHSDFLKHSQNDLNGRAASLELKYVEVVNIEIVFSEFDSIFIERLDLRGLERDVAQVSIIPMVPSYLVIYLLQEYSDNLPCLTEKRASIQGPIGSFSIFLLSEFIIAQYLVF